MSVVEKVKAKFEGDTRDLERRIAKLDGDMDKLTREQRMTRFAAQTLVAFEVFTEVGPIVAHALSSVVNAAVKSSEHVEEVTRQQAILNAEWGRSQAILGGAIIGDVESYSMKMAGLASVLADVNDKLTMIGKQPPAVQGLIAWAAGAVPGAVAGGIVGGGAGALVGLLGGGALGLAGAAGLKVLEEIGAAESFEFVGPVLPDYGPFPPVGGGVGTGPRRPSIAGAGLDEQGSPLLTIVNNRDEMIDAFGMVTTAVETTEFAFEKGELAAARWSVTLQGAADMASASLQAHLSEQLRFENLKTASGKRIVRETLADIGSQALAEAAYQAALAVGYLFVNPAKAATHAQSAAMLGGIAAVAGGGYALSGGDNDTSGTSRRTIERLDAERESERDTKKKETGSSSSKTVAAGASVGTINFTLTFIYNGPAYYVGPGGLEEFVGEIVPALNDRIDSGELRAIA